MNAQRGPKLFHLAVIVFGKVTIGKFVKKLLSTGNRRLTEFLIAIDIAIAINLRERKREGRGKQKKEMNFSPRTVGRMDR